MLSLDLHKTSNSINHRFLFQALSYYELEPTYITLLSISYCNQSGTVQRSRKFEILRNMKYGNVFNAILFKCVLDVIFENYKIQLHNEELFIEASK